MIRHSILGVIAGLLMVGAAQAQTTINITGATAFRTAAVNAIIATYGAGLTDVAHSGGNNAYQSAQYSIFRGTFPGISGTTIIRATWTGSVEGIRDVSVPQTQNFLTIAAFSAGTAGSAIGGASQRHSVGNGSEPAFPKFAFSDVFGASTPYDTSALSDDIVGVLVFCMVANEGAPANLTNLTSQQFRAIWANGSQPLSLITGNPADTINVYATGRNDGSGTRTHYLAESGYGFSVPVQQWKPTVSSGAITELRAWPTGDGSNASYVWNGDIAGNGGFNSSGTTATAMGATSTAVQRKNAAGANIGSPVSLLLVSSVGINDALTIVTNGGKALSWNGVGITPTNPLSASDVAKITSGAYTHWSYEHLYSSTSLTTDEETFKAALLGALPANLGSAGIDAALMNVSRSEDGGLVGP